MSFSSFYDSFLNFFRRQNSFESIVYKKNVLDSLISIVNKYSFQSTFSLSVFFGLSNFDNKDYFVFFAPIIFSYVYTYYGKFESILHTNLEFKKISLEGFSYSSSFFDVENDSVEDYTLENYDVYDSLELKLHHLNFLKDSGLKFDVFKGVKNTFLTYYVNFISTSTFYGQIALYSYGFTAFLGYTLGCKIGSFLQNL